MDAIKVDGKWVFFPNFSLLLSQLTLDRMTQAIQVSNIQPSVTKSSLSHELFSRKNNIHQIEDKIPDLWIKLIIPYLDVISLSKLTKMVK